MNRSESKYFHTALCMNEALIALLEVKDLEYLTVKEICEKAGVNRSTFYLHYETIADLLDETVETVNKRFSSYFAQNRAGLVDKIEDMAPVDLVFITQDYLIPYLQFVRDNKAIYRASFRNPDGMKADIRYRYLQKNIMEPVLKKFDVPDALWPYYIAFYIHGTIAVVSEWLKRGCQEPAERVAALIEECIRPFEGAKKQWNKE